MTTLPTIKTDGSTTTNNLTTTATTYTTASGNSMGLANQIFLRIRLTPNSEISHTTTINVAPDMHFYEVLDIICQKRKLDSKNYALKIADTNTFINLESTVETVGNAQDLTLVS